MMKSKSKEISERIKTAMKTGITMVSTTLVALTALYFVTDSFILKQMALVLITGIVIDIFSTWFTNAGVLRYWMERREKK
jgi:preprotein translocase subunit SecF